MIKKIIPFLFIVSPVMGQTSIDIRNGLTPAVGDSRYVNSPSESVAQTFTSNLTVGGSVGINTATPDTSAKLNVAGNISTTGQVISSGTGSNYFGGKIQVGAATGSTYMLAVKQTSATDGIYSQSSSNDDLTRLRHSGTAGVLESLYISGGGYTPLTFLTSATERLRIDTGGNVGVGTAAPNTKLHISTGTLKIDGNVQNAITVSGIKTVTLGIGTSAQIKALDPVIAGELIICSNCTVSKTAICVSTGTAVADWADAADTSLACE